MVPVKDLTMVSATDSATGLTKDSAREPKKDSKKGLA
jgi:hypothetical protein